MTFDSASAARVSVSSVMKFSFTQVTRSRSDQSCFSLASVALIHASASAAVGAAFAGAAVAGTSTVTFGGGAGGGGGCDAQPAARSRESTKGGFLSIASVLWCGRNGPKG